MKIVLVSIFLFAATGCNNIEIDRSDCNVKIVDMRTGASGWGETYPHWIGRCEDGRNFKSYEYTVIGDSLVYEIKWHDYYQMKHK